MTGSVKTAVERPTDGVVAELARDDPARKKFLRLAGRTMGSGAAASARGAFIAACGGSSSSFSAGVGATGVTSISSTSASPRTEIGDRAIRNYSMMLECLETDLYTQKGMSVGPSGEARSLAAILGDQKAQHVKALMSTIKDVGGTPVKEAGSTAQVEARHAAGIGPLVHQPDTPIGAFDAALTQTQALAKPDPLIRKG
jgi:hypothetical protein